MGGTGKTGRPEQMWSRCGSSIPGFFICHVWQKVVRIMGCWVYCNKASTACPLSGKFSFFKVCCKLTLHMRVRLQTPLIQVRILVHLKELKLTTRRARTRVSSNPATRSHCFLLDTACKKLGNDEPLHHIHLHVIIPPMPSYLFCLLPCN